MGDGGATLGTPDGWRLPAFDEPADFLDPLIPADAEDLLVIVVVNAPDHLDDADPDDDPLEVVVEFRPVGAAAWATAAISCVMRIRPTSFCIVSFTNKSRIWA